MCTAKAAKIVNHSRYNQAKCCCYTGATNDTACLLKLNNRISLTGKYFYTIPDYKLSGSRNSLSFGIDIETGGHVFQLIFSNSTGMMERTAIGQTTGNWANGDIYFGFNIRRVFTIV